MASPYFQQIRVQQPDFSPITRGAEAYGRGIGEAFRAFGQLGSLYFQEKGFEQQIADYIKTDLGKQMLGQAGVQINPDDPKETIKMAKGVIKSQGGFQEFQKSMQLKMQEERNAEMQKQQNYLFEQQKQEMDAKLDHFNRMSGAVKNPEVAKYDEKIFGVRNEISSLSEQLENEEISGEQYEKSFYDLGKNLSTLKKEKSALSNMIPMNELDPDKFAAAYGPVNSPYQAMLKAGAVRQLQERKDKMDLQGMDTVEKVLRIKNLHDEEEAAAGMSSFDPTSRIVFDQGDAMQQVQDFAEDRKLQLKPEQMEKMAQQITVVSPKDIRSEKKTYEKDNRINDADTVIESSNYLLNFLDTKNDKGENNPLTDTAAIEKLARMLQPTGILTEEDIARVSGSAGLVDRFERALQKAKDGTLDASSRQDLKDAAQAFQKVAFELKIKGTESAINEISKSYVNPNDPHHGAFKKQVRDRFFSEEYNNIPEEFLPENANRSIAEAKDGQNIKIMYQGKETVVELDRTLPSGKRVVIINGEKKIIDGQ
jgi:hypothetical protein